MPRPKSLTRQRGCAVPEAAEHQIDLVMRGSFNEIYRADAATLRFVDANAAALSNLQCSLEQLCLVTVPQVMPDLDPGLLRRARRTLAMPDAPPLRTQATHVRRSGTTYPVETSVLLHRGADGDEFVIVGNDLSDRQEWAALLADSEARLRAIVSSTPGLVFQLVLEADGQIAFPYLSEHCHALLGLAPDVLERNPARFEELILADDRPAFRQSMSASARSLKAWNWEGRFAMKRWKDVKWINLRSTPRALDGAAIQWAGIMTNITRSKLAAIEITRARARMKELSAHVEQIKEQERERMARDIHDGIGGNLAAVKMALSVLVRRLPEGDAHLIERAGYIEALVDRTIDEAKRISADLRPGILDIGIAAALDWQAQEFTRQSGLPCELAVNMPDTEDIEPDPVTATVMFRIFQEALTNVGKHARASHVHVRLGRDAEAWSMEIADNGRGIAVADRAKVGSFGIHGMSERAQAAGGSVHLAEAPAGGTLVSVRIPLGTPGRVKSARTSRTARR